MSWWIYVALWGALVVGFVIGALWRNEVALRKRALDMRAHTYGGVPIETMTTTSWIWPAHPGSAGNVAVISPNPPTRPPLAAVADQPRRLEAVE